MYTNDSDVRRLALTAFPEYNGHRFQVQIAKSVDSRR